MTAATKPQTETELIRLVTHVDCLTCQLRAQVRPEFLGQFQDVDTLRAQEPDCGCHDPLPEWVIYSDRPLFGGELDDAAEIKPTHSAVPHWEYVVDEDLVEDLGISS